jgi:hypothetical protein
MDGASGTAKRATYNKGGDGERVRAWIEANIPGEELPDVTVAQVKMEEGDRDRPQRGTPRKG